jgi:DNA repair protein RadC
MKWSSALRGESNQTGSNLYQQVDDRKESNVEQPELFKFKPPRIRKRKEPQEYKVIALRECPLPEGMHVCETPEHAADYWRKHVTTTSHYDPERECFVVLMLNTRRRIKGHQFISIGTLDTLLVHPREVFRAACVVAASALVLMHNHPSGDPTPSEADIKITRDLIRAGQLMKIEVIDHVIVGAQRHSSLRTLGYFY